MTEQEEAAPPKEQPIFHLDIFQTLDQAQSSHGIPHQDYAQYHEYCRHKLTRFRHHREVRSTLTHNHKYVEGKSGRRHAYCSREVPELIEHENIIWNVFFEAERSWAQACALQSQMSRHANVQRRLNKAVKYAERLEEIVNRCCDEQTQKEVHAYATWIKANAFLEQKKHLEAYHSYKESMNILLQLAKDLKGDSPDDLALGDIWTTRAETVLRPLVRFCQYEVRDQLDPSELGEAATTTTTTTASSSESSSIVLHFRGKDIALDSYKQLAVLYLKMENLLKNHDHLDEKQFLQLSLDLDDALRLVQEEFNHYASVPAGPAVMAKRQELQMLTSFFSYQKLAVWRYQQESRVATLQEDAEIVHVYDALQQNAQAMADLPGAEGEDLEEDPFWLEAQAHVVRIRAFRCYYLARLYESTLNGTPAQVLALLRQASKLTKRAMEEVAACEMEHGDAYLDALEDLKERIKAMTCRVEATRYLQVAAGGRSSANTDRPLWLRLDDLDAGTVLADDPPLPIPMPCKPAFYDMAWQHVGALPVDALQDYIAANEPKKSSGLLGWFSS